MFWVLVLITFSVEQNWPVVTILGPYNAEQQCLARNAQLQQPRERCMRTDDVPDYLTKIFRNAEREPKKSCEVNKMRTFFAAAVIAAALAGTVHAGPMPIMPIPPMRPTEWLLLSVFVNLKATPPLVGTPEVAGRYDTEKDCHVAMQWAMRTINKLKLPDKDLGEIQFGYQPLPPRWPHADKEEKDQPRAEEPEKQ